MKKYMFLAWVFCWMNAVLAQKTYEANWESLDKRPVPAWYQDAKFGIFVHWGVYSVPAWAPNSEEVYTRYAEWYWHRIQEGTHEGIDFVKFHKEMYGDKAHYQDFASQFKAELFCPEQWADLFQRSGARYVVLTSKHHEGFALWPSTQSVNWNAVDIGPHRDLCGELTEAVRKKGLHMGFYYSLYEWYHPMYKNNVIQYVDEHMLPQLRDLTIRYQPDIIWTDGEWEHTSSVWRAEEFLQWLYNDSPVADRVVVNDRWGKETRGCHGGFYTTEYDLVHDTDSRGQVFTHPWEECRGIGGSFGYNRGENIENYASTRQLIHLLIEKVSRGGNLLLNVGPTADGRIPVIMQERLLQLGNWLSVNGEAIYGSQQWVDMPMKNRFEGVSYTKKDAACYVLLTDLQPRHLTIFGLPRVKNVELLGSGKHVKWKQRADGLSFDVPVLSVTEAPSTDAWVVKISY